MPPPPPPPPSTPNSLLIIKVTMAKDNKIINRPITADFNIFLALSTLSVLPG